VPWLDVVGCQERGWEKVGRTGIENGGGLGQEIRRRGRG